MIDFSDLVLGPCMETFAEPMIVDPVASQPGAVPYQARGVFTSRPYQVELGDGTVVADQQTTIGYRLSEFAVPPTARDLITVRGTQYISTDLQADGQGGATLILRRTKPSGTTILPAGYLWPAGASLAGAGAMVHAIPATWPAGATLSGAGGMAAP